MFHITISSPLSLSRKIFKEKCRVGEEYACNSGDVGLIPGEGNGNPLQYLCLENSMDRGAWQAVIHGVADLDMTVTGHTYHNGTINY